MVALDNSAWRLLRVMTVLSEGQPSEQHLATALASGGRAALTLPEVAGCLVLAHDLTHTVEQDVLGQLRDQDPALVREVTGQCRYAVLSTLRQLGRPSTGIGHHETRLLTIWAELLDHAGPARRSPDALDTLARDLAAVRRTIDAADAAGDLDPELRALVREMAFWLSRAVRDALVVGPRAVEEALHTIQGHLDHTPRAKARLSDAADRAHPIVTALATALATAGAIAGLTADTLAAAQGLEPGTPGGEVLDVDRAARPAAVSGGRGVPSWIGADRR